MGARAKGVAVSPGRMPTAASWCGVCGSLPAQIHMRQPSVCATWRRTSRLCKTVTGKMTYMLLNDSTPPEKHARCGMLCHHSTSVCGEGRSHLIFICFIRSEPILEVLQNQANPWQRWSKPLTLSRVPKISLISKFPNGERIRY